MQLPAGDETAGEAQCQKSSHQHSHRMSPQCDLMSRIVVNQVAAKF
jgi:hypothetical protein